MGKQQRIGNAAAAPVAKTLLQEPLDCVRHLRGTFGGITLGKKGTKLLRREPPATGHAVSYKAPQGLFRLRWSATPCFQDDVELKELKQFLPKTHDLVTDQSAKVRFACDLIERERAVEHGDLLTLSLDPSLRQLLASTAAVCDKIEEESANVLGTNNHLLLDCNSE